MSDIYNYNLLYPLTSQEYNELDNVWEFINEFNFLTYSLHDYRKRIIKSINKKYSLNDFYILENIAEKLFWNLRHKTYPLFLEKKHKCIDDILQIKEGLLHNLLDDMYCDNSYRSFINKLILIDDINDKCYYKKIEGSSDIFYKNKFNLYTATVLSNRGLYELVMQNPQRILEIEIPEFYYEYDYPFPNLNYGKPFIYTKKYRLQRIQNMYYDTDAERNWFKLIRPV